MLTTRGHVDADPDHGVGGILTDGQRALHSGEPAADPGQAQMPDDEPELAVVGVQHPHPGSRQFYLVHNAHLRTGRDNR